MATKRIRSFDVLSAGKIMGVMYAAMGLLIGGIFSIVSLLGFAIGAGQGNEDAFFSLFFGVGAIVVLPIFYGVMGFLFGLISALVYNLIAGLIGGLELELEDAGPAVGGVASPAPQAPPETPGSPVT